MKQHKHVYGSSAIRGKQLIRYCSVAGCTHTLVFYGNGRRPEVKYNNDVALYGEMAKRYGI
jgi:hypothetical protein